MQAECSLRTGVSGAASATSVVDVMDGGHAEPVVSTRPVVELLPHSKSGSSVPLSLHGSGGRACEASSEKVLSELHPSATCDTPVLHEANTHVPRNGDAHGSPAPTMGATDKSRPSSSGTACSKGGSKPASKPEGKDGSSSLSSKAGGKPVGTPGSKDGSSSLSSKAGGKPAGTPGGKDGMPLTKAAGTSSLSSKAGGKPAGAPGSKDGSSMPLTKAAGAGKPGSKDGSSMPSGKAGGKPVGKPGSTAGDSTSTATTTSQPASTPGGNDGGRTLSSNAVRTPASKPGSKLESNPGSKDGGKDGRSTLSSKAGSKSESTPGGGDGSRTPSSNAGKKPAAKPESKVGSSTSTDKTTSQPASTPGSKDGSNTTSSKRTSEPASSSGHTGASTHADAPRSGCLSTVASAPGSAAVATDAAAPRDAVSASVACGVAPFPPVKKRSHCTQSVSDGEAGAGGVHTAVIAVGGATHLYRALCKHANMSEVRCAHQNVVPCARLEIDELLEGVARTQASRMSEQGTFLERAAHAPAASASRCASPEAKGGPDQVAVDTPALQFSCAEAGTADARAGALATTEADETDKAGGGEPELAATTAGVGGPPRLVPPPPPARAPTPRPAERGKESTTPPAPAHGETGRSEACEKRTREQADDRRGEEKGRKRLATERSATDKRREGSGREEARTRMAVEPRGSERARRGRSRSRERSERRARSRSPVARHARSRSRESRAEASHRRSHDKAAGGRSRRRSPSGSSERSQSPERATRRDARSPRCTVDEGGSARRRRADQEPARRKREAEVDRVVEHGGAEAVEVGSLALVPQSTARARWLNVVEQEMTRPMFAWSAPVYAHAFAQALAASPFVVQELHRHASMYITFPLCGDNDPELRHVLLVVLLLLVCERVCVRARARSGCPDVTPYGLRHRVEELVAESVSANTVPMLLAENVEGQQEVQDVWMSVVHDLNHCPFFAFWFVTEYRSGMEHVMQNLSLWCKINLYGVPLLPVAVAQLIERTACDIRNLGVLFQHDGDPDGVLSVPVRRLFDELAEHHIRAEVPNASMPPDLYANVCGSCVAVPQVPNTISLYRTIRLRHVED